MLQLLLKPLVLKLQSTISFCRLPSLTHIAAATTAAGPTSTVEHCSLKVRTTPQEFAHIFIGIHLPRPPVVTDTRSTAAFAEPN